MNILKLKYKMHRMVNIVFYLVIFTFGFLLGFGIDKLNFNNLISKVFMLDNVYAFDVDEYSWDSIKETTDGKNIYYKKEIGLYDVISKKPNSSTYYDEQTLYNLFNDVSNQLSLNISFEDYSNVYSSIYDEGVWNNYYITYSSSDFTGTYGNIFTNSKSGIFELYINKYQYIARLTYYVCKDDVEDCSFKVFDGSIYSSKAASSSTNIPDLGHYMDFSDYIPKIELVYDENLFKNDENFKEVCVNNYDKFSIISKNYTTIGDETASHRVLSDTDFIWFKNGLKGLKTKLYNSKSENYVLDIEESSFYPMYDDFYWLNSVEVIDSVFSSENAMSNYLTNKGYIDKYLYYNYSLHPFINTFDNSDDTYLFNIFWFDNPTTLHISSNDTTHGGGGITLGKVDHELYSEQYCFYVKKDYDVIIHDINEWGDINTDTTILGDQNINFSTTENESEVRTDIFVNIIVDFISQMSDVFNIINSLVTDFYLSMPLLLRMFILSVLSIFFMKYLIDMIVR